MYNTHFKDEQHKRFFYSMLMKARKQDVYHQAFFYLMGLTEDTRRHIGNLFDFDDDSARPENFHQGWQTSGMYRITRMALNMWNGWTEEGAEALSAPDSLFDCSLAPFFWEAIKLRYPSECAYYQLE